MQLTAHSLDICETGCISGFLFGQMQVPFKTPKTIWNVCETGCILNWFSVVWTNAGSIQNTQNHMECLLDWMYFELVFCCLDKCRFHSKHPKQYGMSVRLDVF